MLATAVVWWLSVADTSASGLKFGGFTETVPHPGETFNQIPYYFAIAVGAGLIGAAFCEMNLVISKWRRRKMLGRKWCGAREGGRGGVGSGGGRGGGRGRGPPQLHPSPPTNQPITHLSPRYRVNEALICVALTTSLGFLLPMLPYEWGGGCRSAVANPLCTGLENK